MASYGRNVLGQTARRIRVVAEQTADFKPGGITLDWGTVPAAAADTTLPDDLVVKTGKKGLRFGQILAMIGIAEVQTVTFTGGPTAGSAILTLPAAGTEPAQSTAAIAFNATADAFRDALAVLTRIGAGGVAVARTGVGSAADPFVYTLTFARRLGDVPQLTGTHTFTGGTAPAVTLATTTAGSAGGGKFGPYDPAATDGRQTLVRGECYILDESVLEEGFLALAPGATDHPAVVEGGLLWKARILMTLGAASLATGPTVTNFETAFPRVRYAQ